MINPHWKKVRNQSAFVNAVFDTSFALSKQLGFQYILSTTDAQNQRMLRNLGGQHDRLNVVGTIPDAVYLESRGFTDIVVFTLQHQVNGSDGQQRSNI